ncbi:MAG: plastocyanin/azurin family copper-binding protein [Candidatus Nitrosocosmicus sp.]|nr:plastocyanin/azurin family copper-binding protein [Candidatus Nitrosocosmicus sp.]
MTIFKIFYILLILFSISCIYNQLDIVNHTYAQEQESNETIVNIPNGAANPEVDITNLSPRQWYQPSQTMITINDTVTWINNDTEPHTVTSGVGGGINSLLTNSPGQPSGIFDSGLFSTDDSVSIKFNNSGTYNYFCTIHPWMEGIVQVVNPAGTTIPSFAVDEFGNKIDDFPLYNFTDDERVEIGLSWNPTSIATNEPISFIMDFYEFPENSRMHLWPYNFVIIQNGTEIYRTNGITQVGSSVQSYTFSSAGKTIIKVESAENKSSFIPFGTTVYQNPYGNSTNMQNVSDDSFRLISPLTLVYAVYAILIILPLFLVAIIILYKKKKI